MERTLAIIKPDAMQAGFADDIIEMIQAHGFKIVAEKETHWSLAEAELFYDIHKDRPFYRELVDFMVSGPIILMVLEKENAVADWRKLMGSTNPDEAEAGTVRNLYGANIGENATHGSDSVENAKREIGLFFPQLV